jgi:hypothetical protein
VSESVGGGIPDPALTARVTRAERLDITVEGYDLFRLLLLDIFTSYKKI